MAHPNLIAQFLKHNTALDATCNVEDKTLLNAVEARGDAF
jgi:hypothetical protein